MGRKSTIKDRVLRLAREKFLKHGFYKISMDNLVRELRTSKSSLYNHFDSKESLVEAVLIALNIEINHKLEEVLSDDQLTFKGKLIAISAFTKQILTEVSEEFLSDLEVHTPDLWDKYQKMRKKRINNYYGKLFEIGINKGVIRSDIDPALILSVYLSLTEIPIKFKHINHLGMAHEEVYGKITEIFLNGVLRQD
ncbi:MAG: TetR/AcrR family transcriptional regulator [Fulvivirga sp.]